MTEKDQIGYLPEPEGLMKSQGLGYEITDNIQLSQEVKTND